MSAKPGRLRSRLAAAALVAGALVAGARAEKVFSSKEELEKRATHVLTGTVESVTAMREIEGAWEYVRYRALVRVGALEKGAGFAAGGTGRRGPAAGASGRDPAGAGEGGNGGVEIETLRCCE